MDDEHELLRKVNSQNLHEIWEHAKAGDLDELSEEERQYARLMLEHEEYHNQFEFADVLEGYPFSAEGGTNPYLHITIHVIVENQLSLKEPIEAYQFYNAMRKKKLNHHEAIHMIGYIFTPLIYQVVMEKKPFNIELYERLLKKYRDRKPEKIPQAVDRELDFLFK